MRHLFEESRKISFFFLMSYQNEMDHCRQTGWLFIETAWQRLWGNKMAYSVTD